MIDSVHGKTMENLRKRIDLRLENNEKDFLEFTSRLTHLSHKMFDKIFATIHEIMSILMLNKPLYVGFTVLEISQWLLNDFHCQFIKKL